MVTAKKNMLPYKRKDIYWGYLFIFPAMLFIAVWIIYPLLTALKISFESFNYLMPEKTEWVGLKNYIRAFSDERFLTAVYNTVRYSVIVVPVQTTIAVFLALVCNNQIKGKTFFRVAYYIPSVTSAVAVASIFIFLFNKHGVINKLLIYLGFPAVSWDSDIRFALPLCMIMAIWATAGGQMLVFLAGLQDIPKSLLEAAQVDGANSSQRLFKIILPLLRPSIFFALATGLIGTLQVFDQAFLVSRGNGGPSDATLTVVLYIFLKGFRETTANMGYPAAMAFLLFIMIFILTYIEKKFLDKSVEY